MKMILTSFNIFYHTVEIVDLLVQNAFERLRLQLQRATTPALASALSTAPIATATQSHYI